MGAERASEELHHEFVAEGIKLPVPDFSISAEGGLRLQAAEGTSDFDYDIGSVDFMEDQMLVTIGKHHFRSSAEIDNLNHALEQAAAIENVNRVSNGTGEPKVQEIALVRADKPFKKDEKESLGEFGFHRARFGKVVHIQKMVKALPASES